MRRLVLRKNRDQVLIGEPSEATKLALELDNIIDKLCNSMSLESF